MALLEVRNLSKKFKGKEGDITAVDGLTFSVEAGQIFGLLGPNGAGKTTTIRVLATTLQATDGTAIIDGHDIIGEPEAVRATIGVLTTDIGLYDRFTGRENLEYYGMLYGLSGERLRRRIEELISLLRMEDFIDRKAGKYSTGMKQKVAIARSVVHDPKVIILDEPTSGLDVLASQTVIRFIKHAREAGKLVVLSTHQMHDAERLCDRVAIIHRGKLVTNSTVQELRERTGETNLEDIFLKLVNGDREPETLDRNTREKTKEDAGSKRKIAVVLRIASFIVILIGIVLSFTLTNSTWGTVGTALIVIGALGAMAAKIFLKKLRK
ncbi:MAG: ATP-binding cassette domain-containing protein [Patescibacteria group bacterium]